MSAPRTIDQFLDVVKKSGVLDESRLDARVVPRKSLDHTADDRGVAGDSGVYSSGDEARRIGGESRTDPFFPDRDGGVCMGDVVQADGDGGAGAGDRH